MRNTQVYWGVPTPHIITTCGQPRPFLCFKRPVDMRLININTYELGEFIGTPENPIPPYVILSHTWGQNEVTYNEMMSSTAATLEKDGYIKIRQFAKTLALWNASSNDAIEHVWVDTCCMITASILQIRH